ncbi:MAG TPA: hypothetical protein VLC46_09385 [Thermoanaerobaculia bacterium]|jgi:hypothetical protein|nr:hypothetical protein [Thermoanaerobaculia bacterium]
MATPIEVIATGIIMFANGASMQSEPAAALRAAIAIEAPGPRIGAYGVKIPEHQARLVILKPAATIISDPQKRVTVVHENGQPAMPAIPSVSGSGYAEVPDADYYVIYLRGDRIQFGAVVTDNTARPPRKTCVPTPMNPSGASPSTNMLVIPNIAELAASPTLAADTFPHHDNYATISPSKVAGWLDLNGGQLTAELRGDGRTGDFRPKRVQKFLPLTISWTFDSDPSLPLCIAVTPFNGMTPGIAIAIDNSAPRQIGYQNVPIGLMEDIHAGISYDYELFYEILESKPCPPPLPFGFVCEFASSGAATSSVMHPNTFQPRRRPYSGPHADESTGINCGPVKNGG